MKNFMMHLAVLFITVCANAQVSVDIHAGANFSTLGQEDLDETTKEKILPGMVAGVHVYIPAGRIGIITGIDVKQKGKKYEDADQYFSTKLTISTFYLEMPAQVQIFFNKKGGVGLYALAGGYLGYGIGGKVKATWEDRTTGQKESESEEISWGSGDDEMARFDAGLSAGLGYKFKKGLFVQTVYNHGLINMSNDSDEKIQHRGLAFSLGWRFGTGKSK